MIKDAIANVLANRAAAVLSGVVADRSRTPIDSCEPHVQIHLRADGPLKMIVRPRRSNKSALASLKQTSFIIHRLGWQVGTRLVSPQTPTIRSLVCSREMRPLAFLDPSAFPSTDPVKLPTCRSNGLRGN